MKFLLFIIIVCIIASLCSCSKFSEDIHTGKKVYIISKRFTNPPDINSDKTWKPYKTIVSEITDVDWQPYYGVKPDTLISSCSIDKIDSLFKIEIRIFEVR